MFVHAYVCLYTVFVQSCACVVFFEGLFSAALHASLCACVHACVYTLVCIFEGPSRGSAWVLIHVNIYIYIYAYVLYVFISWYVCVQLF